MQDVYFLGASKNSTFMASCREVRAQLKIATRHAVIVLVSFVHALKLEPASSLEQISYFDFSL